MNKISAKIVLIGSIGVGKTSLIRQFVHGEFADEYLSTIGVKVDKKTIELSETTVDLLVWDIAGEIYLSNLFNKYLKGAAGVIGVFDITRPETHDNLIEIFEELKKNTPTIHKTIIANKSDLLDDKEHSKYIRSNYTYDFMTSAKTGVHVQDAFTKMACTIITSI